MYPIFVQSPMGSNSPYIASQGSPTSPSYSAFQGVGYSYQAPPSPAATSQNNQSPSRSYMGHGQTDTRRTNLSRGSRPHNHTSSHHNHVDTHRIREGIDVRTTVSLRGTYKRAISHKIQIMLRNIPNKVDQAMLKRIIDESSWGKYDFMYLRIDFANDCKYVNHCVSVDPQEPKILTKLQRGLCVHQLCRCEFTNLRLNDPY